MGKYKNLLLNTGLFALNSVATRLVSFVLVPFYTAYMTAGEYGITDMSLTVINLVGPIATLCVAGSVMRFIVADKRRGGQYTAVAGITVLASIVLVAILSPLLDLGFFGGLGEYKLLFVAAYGMNVLVDLCANIARGLGRIKLIPFCSGTSALVTLASALVAVGWLGLGVKGYFVAVITGPAAALALYASVGSLASIAMQGAKEIIRSPSVSKRLTELCVPVFRYSLPLIPNSLFWWAQTSISRLFITGMLGIAASGLFAAASIVPNLINTAYNIFQQAWQLSSFQESESDTLSGFYETIFRLIQAVLTVLCAVLSLSSPLVASILLQGETFGAWPMVPILLLANLASVFSSFYGTIYTTTMHTSYIMRTTVVGAAACVMLTPTLISLLGTYGACISTAISQTLVFLMRARDSRRYVTFNVDWSYLVPTFIILIAQAAVTSLQFVNWQVVSAACLLIVTLIQGRQVAPVARKALVAVKGSSLRHRS